MQFDLPFWFTMLFFVSEVILSRVRSAESLARDRGSLKLLYWTIGISVTAGIFIAVSGVGGYAISPFPRVLLCAGLISVGAAIRWTAIVQLGKQFSVGVELKQDHFLLQRGLYRHLRHPSYSGLLLEFTGLGFYFANWISAAVIVLPVFAALCYRIHVEELALRERFQDEYTAYAARSSRLIPRVW